MDTKRYWYEGQPCWLESIFRFANEHESLCRQIMCAKSGNDPNRLLSHFDRSSRKSVLLNLIGSILDRNLKASEIVQRDF